jgi:hypothetical protein
MLPVLSIRPRTRVFKPTHSTHSRDQTHQPQQQHHPRLRAARTHATPRDFRSRGQQRQATGRTLQATTNAPAHPRRHTHLHHCSLQLLHSVVNGWCRLVVVVIVVVVAAAVVVASIGSVCGHGAVVLLHRSKGDKKEGAGGRGQAVADVTQK